MTAPGKAWGVAESAHEPGTAASRLGRRASALPPTAAAYASHRPDYPAAHAPPPLRGKEMRRMFQFDFVLALALLTAPPDTVDATITAEAGDRLRPVLQTLAVQMEILDPREVRYI